MTGPSSAAARVCSRRRSRSRRAGLQQRPQSDRVLAQYAGPRHHRQRPDVRRQSLQSGASGQLLELVGSSLGLSTNLGGNPGTVFSTERFNPDIWRYSIGVERELPWQLVAEVSYPVRRAATC